MLFHSHEFLALLGITLVAFNLARTPQRPTILLAASLIFYGYAGIGMLALFLAVAGVAYACLRRIEAGDRKWAAIGVLLILANLVAFKYAVFLLDVAAASGMPVAPA